MNCKDNFNVRVYNLIPETDIQWGFFKTIIN